MEERGGGKRSGCVYGRCEEGKKRSEGRKERDGVGSGREVVEGDLTRKSRESTLNGERNSERVEWLSTGQNVMPHNEKQSMRETERERIC